MTLVSTSQGLPSSGQISVFMFTDLVGSSELKVRIGDGSYLCLLQQHNIHFERLIARAAGAEIIKHTGDGYLATFQNASDAAACAMLFQRAMHNEDWQKLVPAAFLSGPLQSRIGIHLGQVGSVLQAGRADRVGFAADLAARVMSKAMPSQILMTRIVFDTVRQHLPYTAGKVEYRCHGFYRLKGMPEPVELIEIGEPGVAPLHAPRREFVLVTKQRVATLLLIVLACFGAHWWLQRYRVLALSAPPAVTQAAAGGVPSLEPFKMLTMPDHPMTVERLTFDPTGAALRAEPGRAMGEASDLSGMKWDMASGKGEPASGAFDDQVSPDGKWLYSRGRLISQSGGKTIDLGDYRLRDRPLFAALAPRLLIATINVDRPRLRVFNTDTGDGLFDITPFGTGMSGYDLSPDGNRLVAASGPIGRVEGEPRIRAWDLTRHTEYPNLEWKGQPRIRLRFSRDGSQVCAMGILSGMVQIYDVVAGTHHPSFPVTFQSVHADSQRFSGTIVPAERRFLVVWWGNLNSDKIAVWDATAAQTLGQIELPGILTADPVPSPDGTRLLTADSGHSVRLWDLQTCKQIAVSSAAGHAKAISALAFSADGSMAASGGEDDHVVVWRLPDSTDGARR